jgi:regulation of enolase protein 1 (concanavalin A-like superfamily)
MKKIFTCLGVLLASVTLYSVSCAKTNGYRVEGIPHEMQLYNTAAGIEISGSTITLTGGGGSRLYVDPNLTSSADSAPMLLFSPGDTFMLSCKVTADLNSVFDAGVLMLYADSENWAKFCLEYSADKKPMIVTVVNNTVSDDCDHFVLESNESYMRISGLGGGIYAMHTSADGGVWRFVRYFKMNTSKEIKAGFLSQSPRGSSCTTVFSDIKYSAQKLGGLRSGE